MVDAIAKIDTENQTRVISIGTPGPTDANGRIAKVAINLPQWYDIPLASEIEARTSKATVITNDANCAGLGEAWLGAGRSFQNFILLILGTGVAWCHNSKRQFICYSPRDCRRIKYDYFQGSITEL